MRLKHGENIDMLGLLPAVIMIGLLISEIGLTGYGIYQLFQGEYMAAIAAALIVLVLKQFSKDLSNFLALPSKLLESLEQGDRYVYDGYDDDDDDDPVIVPSPRNVRTIGSAKKKKTQKRRR